MAAAAPAARGEAAPVVEEGSGAVGKGRRGAAESMVAPAAVECGAGQRISPAAAASGERGGDATRRGGSRAAAL